MATPTPKAPAPAAGARRVPAAVHPGHAKRRRRLRELDRCERALRVVVRASGFPWGTWYTPAAIAWQQARGVTLDELWTRRMITYRDRARAAAGQAAQKPAPSRTTKPRQTAATNGGVHPTPKHLRGRLTAQRVARGIPL